MSVFIYQNFRMTHFPLFRKKLISPYFYTFLSVFVQFTCLLPNLHVFLLCVEHDAFMDAPKPLSCY